MRDRSWSVWRLVVPALLLIWLVVLLVVVFVGDLPLENTVIVMSQVASGLAIIGVVGLTYWYARSTHSLNLNADRQLETMKSQLAEMEKEREFIGKQLTEMEKQRELATKQLVEMEKERELRYSPRVHLTGTALPHNIVIRNVGGGTAVVIQCRYEHDGQTLLEGYLPSLISGEERAVKLEGSLSKITEEDQIVMEYYGANASLDPRDSKVSYLARFVLDADGHILHIDWGKATTPRGHE